MLRAPAIRIVLCANTSWYLYNFRKNLIAALQHQGCEVYAVSPRDDYAGRLTEMGVRWHALNLHGTSRNPAREGRALGQLFRHLRAIAPHVVMSYTVKCNIYLGLLRYLLPYRLIVTISGLGEGFDERGWLQTVIRLLYRAALRHARKVFFQNREDLLTFTQCRILPAARCERIPGSGVDLRQFAPDAENRRPHRRRFLMFGRIVPQKGYDLFLEVARRVRSQSPEAAEFWILGIEDHSRPESMRLLATIRDVHARQIVTYFPGRPDVRPLLRQSDVVVLPSRYHEGVPRCLLEGMACGKPVITTNWKGCRDAVDDRVSGLLVEPGNGEALYQAVQFFLQASDDTIRRMGMAGRAKVAREFDERQVVHAYLSELPG
jgi:glycosyltransferase involved in cell wall biosynthesis